MRLLLDTHIFLWFISGDSRLPVKWTDNIRNTRNEVSLSVVSIWEAIVKYHLGKLPLPHPPETWLPIQRNRHQITSVPIEEASVRHLAALPAIHRDPFDRMLVCQALEYGLTIVTIDPIFESYPAPILKRE